MKARLIDAVAESGVAAESRVVTLARSNHYGYETLSFEPPDPFLMFQDVSGDCAGVPEHPHAGIETVTYIERGTFRHRNSKGGLGTVGPGGIQVMVAGKGLIHAEDQVEGPVRAFQLWLKLPEAQERCEPRYHADAAENVFGPLGVHAESVTPISYWHIKSSTEIKGVEDWQAFAYVSRGTADVSGLLATQGQAVVLKRGAPIDVMIDDGEVLVIAAQPHGENVARHAGFASSSKSGLLRAYHGYLTGRFGALKG